MSRRITLARAERLLRARKYGQVISALEPQVFLYRENAEFYRVLGTACLYAGDYSGASSYLRRADQLTPGVTGILLGLAAIDLRRREIPEALRYWLSILDKQPSNRRARRGLSLVRTTADPVDFVTMAESGRLKRIFPPLPLFVPRWLILGVIGAAITALAIIYLPGAVQTLAASASRQRTGAEEIELSDLTVGLVEDEGNYRYELTESEVEQIVSHIGTLFNDYRDNLAQREANRILNSNASPLVKERVRLISSYFREPTFQDFSDNFTYEEVAAEPWLYDGCYVLWSGQTSNVVQAEDGRTRFRFLVGYVDQQVLDGIVDAVSDATFDFRRGPIEAIGRITYRDEHLLLTVTSPHRILPTAEN